MKKLIILSSILFSVNSLLTVNYCSAKSVDWGSDKTTNLEKFCKFCSANNLVDSTNKSENAFHFSNKSVELEYFDAKFLNEGIMIKWQSLSNNKDLKFELQKSYDGIYFEKLTIIDNDCKSEDYFYTFLDTELKLNSEIVYYRLKQIDNKERFNYSDIIYLDSTNDLVFNF